MDFSLTPFPFDLSLSEIIIKIPMGILIIYLIVSYYQAVVYVRNVDLYMSRLQGKLELLTLTRNGLSRLIYIATAATGGEAHTKEAKDWGDEMHKMEGSCLRIVREYNNNSSRGIRGTTKRWRISKQAKAAAEDLLGVKKMLRDTLRFETECIVRAKQRLSVVAYLVVFSFVSMLVMLPACVPEIKQVYFDNNSFGCLFYCLP